MSATAATETAAAAATAATLLLRTGLVHHEIPATEILTIHRINRAVGFFVVGNFDECEATRLARKTVTDEIDCRGVDSRLREEFMQRIFRGGKRKISNVKLLHLRTPFARNQDACRGARWKPGESLRASGSPKPRLISGSVSTNPETC